MGVALTILSHTNPEIRSLGTSSANCGVTVIVGMRQPLVGCLGGSWRVSGTSLEPSPCWLPLIVFHWCCFIRGNSDELNSRFDCCLCSGLGRYACSLLCSQVKAKRLGDAQHHSTLGDVDCSITITWSVGFTSVEDDQVISHDQHVRLSSALPLGNVSI